MDRSAPRSSKVTIFLTAAISCLAGGRGEAADDPAPGTPAAPGLRFESAFLTLEASPSAPGLVELTVDSLGREKRPRNPLRPPAARAAKLAARREGSRIEYRAAGPGSAGPAPWAIDLAEKRIRLTSSWSDGSRPEPLVLDFDPRVCHATLLGRMEPDGSVTLPALLHLPDQGTFRVTVQGAGRTALGFSARRFGGEFVKVSFPPASASRPGIEYDLEAVAIHPSVPGIEGDRRFDGFRRNWLNIFQQNPAVRALANNAASDPCPITVFAYAEIAARTPPLAEGLTALDLIRDTLDRYLEGMLGYGIAGYIMYDNPDDPGQGPYDFLDTYPSLLIAAGKCFRGSGGRPWLERRYPRLAAWAGKMLAFDADGDGLLEYPASGNAGSWKKEIPLRPANWWDTIGFGHKDAYSNALAFRALRVMEELAGAAGKPEEARRFGERAEKLRAAYLDAFLNPKTGVLAGWRSADGKLHDYHFTFVNGTAISLGLVPRERAGGIMDRLLGKMREAGFTRFELGLPGNLVPIRREDYVHLEKRWGGPEKEDGSDAFEIYENGGATACFVYFTLNALYGLGRREEADAMLFPMLRAFEEGGFSGFGPGGESNDWKAWDGTPHGYEGFLTDGYLTLLAVLARSDPPSIR